MGPSEAESREINVTWSRFQTPLLTFHHHDLAHRAPSHVSFGPALDQAEGRTSRAPRSSHIFMLAKRKCRASLTPSSTLGSLRSSAAAGRSNSVDARIPSPLPACFVRASRRSWKPFITSFSCTSGVRRCPRPFLASASAYLRLSLSCVRASAKPTTAELGAPSSLRA
ncbi:hypothetical protein B0H11DRAFT_1247042 [Mycena galericulata]|nr:hypothetical protein B0H11DRAFT_1247042 [Mycena galericulata]